MPTLSDSPAATGGRPAPLLSAEKITSGYGGVPVVRDVSIAVGPAEIVAIIGPNGAGKSTLLKSLVGILRVSEGRVMLDGDDVTNHPPEDLARRGVGYVPQVQDIFEPLTVLENLEMGGYLLPSASDSEAGWTRSSTSSPRSRRCSSVARTSSAAGSARCSPSHAC